MTREDEWAKLAEAATPGPWWAEEDARFIAKARTAVPSLLAEVTRLRAENERLWRRCWVQHPDKPTNPSLIDCCLDRGHEGDHWSTSGCAGSHMSWPDPLAAARVEVSQLRAKIEALCVEWYAEKGSANDEGRGFAAASRLCADEIRAALAEPLGSTPDPPADKS
jgi:hypothetical protein